MSFALRMAALAGLFAVGACHQHTGPSPSGSGGEGGGSATGGAAGAARDAESGSESGRDAGEEPDAAAAWDGPAAPDALDALDAPDGTADAGAMNPGGWTVVPPRAPQVCGTSWSNPITAGVHDPTLIKEGGTYYVFSTADGIDTTRMVPFQRSVDRLHWTNLGTVMRALPAWASALGLTGAPEAWAPDVHFRGGKYFVYYSVSSWGDVTHSAIGLMTNTTLDPSAPGYQWIDRGVVVGSPEGGAGVNVIDPDLFIDDDQSWWLVYGSYRAGIRLVPLDATTGLWTRAVAPVVLTTSLGEGSDIIKANGYYYLVVSRGTCCAALNSTYEIVYGRASKVTGPYVGKNGAPVNTGYVRLLPPGSDGNPGQGGQAFFVENGQYHMVYHAYQPPSGAATLNVRPIYFDADDWITLDPCLAKGYR